MTCARIFLWDLERGRASGARLRRYPHDTCKCAERSPTPVVFRVGCKRIGRTDWEEV